MKVVAYSVGPFPGLQTPFQCQNQEQVAPLSIDSIPVPSIVTTVPELTDFVVNNLGANSVVQRVARLLMYQANGTNLLTLTEKLPFVAPYTLDLLAYASGNSNGGIGGNGLNGFCIALRNAGGSSRTFTLDLNEYQYSIDEWTDDNTWSGSDVAVSSLSVLPWIMALRITDDGTTRTYWASSNGLDYVEIYSEASSTFVPAQVGFGGAALGGAGTFPKMLYVFASFHVSSGIQPQYAP